MLYQNAGSNRCALPNCWVEHPCSTNQFGWAHNQDGKLPACFLEAVSVTFSTIPSPKSFRKKSIRNFCPNFYKSNIRQNNSCSVLFLRSFLCMWFLLLRNIPKLLLQGTWVCIYSLKSSQTPSPIYNWNCSAFIKIALKSILWYSISHRTVGSWVCIMHEQLRRLKHWRNIIADLDPRWWALLPRVKSFTLPMVLIVGKICWNIHMVCW